MYCANLQQQHAILSLSISSEGNRYRIRLNVAEAEAARLLTMIMGVDYVGDDEKIISKIMIMEAQDDGRVKIKVILRFLSTMLDPLSYGGRCALWVFGCSILGF